MTQRDLCFVFPFFLLRFTHTHTLEVLFQFVQLLFDYLNNHFRARGPVEKINRASSSSSPHLRLTDNRRNLES
uniref:Putative secreted protein n=1 Tax=Anopheles marajoara TaxID=58244 RepID=A0A2M4CDQ9_9DIPT